MYDDKEGVLAHEGPNPKVFMDVTIGGEAAGRITMELFADTVPKTAEVRACVFLVVSLPCVCRGTGGGEGRECGGVSTHTCMHVEPQRWRTELPRAVHGGEGPVAHLRRAALLQGLRLPPLHQGIGWRPPPRFALVCL